MRNKLRTERTPQYALQAPARPGTMARDGTGGGAPGVFARTRSCEPGARFSLRIGRPRSKACRTVANSKGGGICANSTRDCGFPKNPFARCSRRSPRRLGDSRRDPPIFEKPARTPPGAPAGVRTRAPRVPAARIAPFATTAGYRFELPPKVLDPGPGATASSETALPWLATSCSIPASRPALAR